MIINDRETEQETPAFLTPEDRGYTAEAWYLKNTESSRGDAMILIKRHGEVIRSFLFPSYKIWNIAAHFEDIVDGELAKSTHGYEIAASTGLEFLTNKE